VPHDPASASIAFLDANPSPRHEARASGKAPSRSAERFFALLAMFGNGFEMATILRTGPDGVTRVVVRHSGANANRYSSTRARRSS